MEINHYMAKNWNIQGIFIPKKFETTDELCALLNLKGYKLQTRIRIDRALTEYFEQRNFAVAHCEYGTIVFHDDISSDDDLLESLSKDYPVLSAYINTMTETYCFDFYKNEKRIRTSWFSVAQPDINQESGEKLEWESSKKRIDIIFKGINSILKEEIQNNTYEVEWYLLPK